MKRAFITGVTGQDGWYLSELLLARGYEVHGISRPKTRKEVPPGVKYTALDVRECAPLIAELRPDEVYNLAAHTFVGSSFEDPSEVMAVNAGAVASILATVRYALPDTRVYQASTSEMFGNSMEGQAHNEWSPMEPVSPYGVAKLAAHKMCQTYRRMGVWVACGIAFNHESPRRGPEFVTAKIARQAAEIKAGKRDRYSLGNVAAERDWGHAEDYVKAMHLMLQQNDPRDFVIATGRSASVWSFARECAEQAGLSLAQIDTDEAMMRPTDINVLVGDPHQIALHLGWRAERDWRDLAKEMVEHELEKLQ